jgi:osmotically-inducible protein OsmY
MPHDRQLQEAVLAELRWEPSVNAAHIGVAADHGVVTLTGHVDSFLQKHAAETAARRVKGTLAIAEDITVRLPIDTERGDDAIAAAAVDRLAWDAAVPRDAVSIRVEQGWVTLTGQLDWHYQQEAAEHAVRALHGVVGLSNQTTIKPRARRADDTGFIRDDIMHALHRSWFFDPSTVIVDETDGRVRLSGTVRSPHERQIAAATAWAAVGTVSVENDIVIN